MRTSTFRCTLFLAGMLTTSLVLAEAAVVKCIDANGGVTLTNEPCATGTLAVPTAGRAAAQQLERHEQMVTLVARVQPRQSAWAKNPVVARKASLDEATLKEARLSMQQSDRAWQASRQMRVASVN